jgi:pantoate--beta-alanine ligase
VSVAPLLVQDGAALRAALRERQVLGTVGFVPTMGFLHEGHSALMRRARATDATVVVSIFVNPTQFGPTEDLALYPRDLPGDLTRCAAEGVDIVFAPTPEVMYPPGGATTVTVGVVTEPLEGERRPGHFQGVATVVTALFNLVRPDHAYFGEKDFQQLAVVRQMVRDLHVPVTIIGVPTVREPDGLALSSRNVRLTLDERIAARCVPEAIAAAVDACHAGERSVAALEAIMAARIAAEPRATLDYAVVVDAATLRPIVRVEREARALVALRIGSVRLIDNAAISG